MPTTKSARATTAASTDHDALQFWCVMFGHLVRHELNRIIRLPYMHTAPLKTLNPELTPDTVPGGADLSLVRHLPRRLAHNLITNESLTTVSAQRRNLEPLTPPMRRYPQLPLPQPTTYNPQPSP
jgi:hypothetical protein